jgi:pyruvate dehydrogenase E2 component (dihydrolipoamide acetyltransferase)
VKPGDNLFEIETDKVSMEVPAIAAGTLAAIHVQAGEVAPVGAVVAIIQGSGEMLAPSQPRAPRVPAPGSAQSAARGQAPAGTQESQALDSRWSLPSGGPQARPGGGNERSAVATPKPPILMEPFREVRSPERNYGPARLSGGTVVTPLARRLAGEAGIELSNVKGSGPHGRIIARDIEQARKAPARAQELATAPIVLTADVAVGQSLALCEVASAAQKTAIELIDVIIKAWGMALARVTPSERSDIAIMMGKTSLVIRAAASKPLTAIATARRDPGGAGDAQDASTAISMPGVPGIASVADALRPPQSMVLSIAAPRRAPVEAPDGSIRFVSVVTVTLSCDHRAVDAALGAELLAAFEGFVEQPVTMIV